MAHMSDELQLVVTARQAETHRLRITVITGRYSTVFVPPCPIKNFLPVINYTAGNSALRSFRKTDSSASGKRDKYPRPNGSFGIQSDPSMLVSGLHRVTLRYGNEPTRVLSKGGRGRKLFESG